MEHESDGGSHFVLVLAANVTGLTRAESEPDNPTINPLAGRLGSRQTIGSGIFGMETCNEKAVYEVP
jgi:hypothetical protein